MTSLLARMSELTFNAPSLDALEKGIVEAIADQLPYCNWTGFYILDPCDPQTLVLGYFAGEPTPHVRIPVAQGICGAAAASGKTVVVDDVKKDPRYLACSLETKSEIVVPIFVHGKVAGELDIDSHFLAAFGDEDRELVEYCAQLVGKRLEHK